jgi:hypothetical protein
VQVARTQARIWPTVPDFRSAPPVPGPPNQPNQKNRSWPARTRSCTRASVGVRTVPLNPPSGMASWPVARMNLEASVQEGTASR